MERSTHAAILQKLALPLSAWPHFHAIAQLFGVSFDTVFSIYSLEVQARVLRTNHVVKDAMAQHAQAWLAGKCCGRAGWLDDVARSVFLVCASAAAAAAAVGRLPQRSSPFSCTLLSGVDAVQLAFQLDFPPCVLMRRLLEHLQLGCDQDEGGGPSSC